MPPTWLMLLTAVMPLMQRHDLRRRSASVKWIIRGEDFHQKIVRIMLVPSWEPPPTTFDIECAASRQPLMDPKVTGCKV